MKRFALLALILILVLFVSPASALCVGVFVNLECNNTDGGIACGNRASSYCNGAGALPSGTTSHSTCGGCSWECTLPGGATIGNHSECIPGDGGVGGPDMCAAGTHWHPEIYPGGACCFYLSGHLYCEVGAPE